MEFKHVSLLQNDCQWILGPICKRICIFVAHYISGHVFGKEQNGNSLKFSLLLLCMFWVASLLVVGSSQFMAFAYLKNCTDCKQAILCRKWQFKQHNQVVQDAHAGMKREHLYQQLLLLMVVRLMVMEISAGAGIVILVKEVHMVRHGEQQGASQARRGAIIVERFVLAVTFILCKNVHINLLISYLVTFDASYRKCLSSHFVCSCNINCVFLLMCGIDIHPLPGASDFSGNVMVTCYYHTCC
jgi:hypothetical protein